METLSDELLGAIFSYLPSIQDLKTLALTNRRLYSFVLSSKTGDELFRELYRHHYPRSEQCWDHRVSGRQLWRDTYYVDQSVRDHPASQSALIRRNGGARPANAPHPRRRSNNGGPEDEQAEAEDVARVSVARSQSTTTSLTGQPLNTVEILPPEEESEAILYDNHDYEASLFFSDRQPCVGYFGLQPLLPTKPNHDSNGNHTPIAIWGDFPGLKVAPCWDALLNARSTHRDRLVSIHDEKQSQVMDLKIHPAWENGLGYTSPFFLGFASGVVLAVASKDDELQVISQSTAHTSEVTALAIVPGGTLLSVCVNGHVYLYPDSLTKLSLAGKICLNPQNVPKFPVFSMSATVFRDRAVLCLGGQGLKLSLWQMAKSQSNNSSLEVISTHEFEYEPHVSFEDPDPNDDEEQVDHNITHVSFVGPTVHNNNSNNILLGTQKQDLLVMGTSRGHIVTWDLLGRPHRPELHLYTSHERVHNGSVESIERVGNILLTNGGNDGVIKAMHLVSGLPLANLLVHPGRLLAPPTPALPVRLKCAVVKSWVCHERQSIIGFCRDGHISEWSFQLHKLAAASASSGTASNRVKKKKKRASSDGAEQRGKRQRRSVSQNVPPVVDSSPNPNPVVPSQIPAVASAAEGTLIHQDAKSETEAINGSANSDEAIHQQQEYSDIPSLLSSLSEEAKNRFNQLGFCKWNKLQRPVLVLSPLSVPAGAIRDEWFKSVQAFRKRSKSRGLPPCLIYWLGVRDARRAYSVVPVSKVLWYDQGLAKHYHQIPNRLQQRLDKGEKLKGYEQGYIDGLGLLPIELAKKPEDRSHLLEEFVSDDSRKKAAPS